MKSIILIILVISLSACSSRDLSVEPQAVKFDIGEIVKINITKTGQTSVADANSENKCGDFTLTQEEIENFFEKTKSVSANDYRHMIDWSRCYVEGELMLADKSAAVWAIHQYRAGSVVLMNGDTVYMYCPKCQGNRFQ